MTEVLSHDKEPEPLPAGARNRPPTYPPAPPGCGEGGRGDGDRHRVPVMERFLLDELELALAAALYLRLTLRDETLIHLYRSPSEWIATPRMRTAVSRVRTRLRWIQVNSLLNFALDSTQVQAFKLQIIEMAERPVATMELEQRWRDSYERLLGAPVLGAWTSVAPDDPPPYRHARQALTLSWLSGRFFIQGILQALMRELDQPENLVSPEAYQEAVLSPLFALLLAAIDVSYAPRRLRNPQRSGGPRRASE